MSKGNSTRQTYSKQDIYQDNNGSQQQLLHAQTYEKVLHDQPSQATQQQPKITPQK